MLHSSPMPLTLLCDFDGTIVPYDIEFEMFARFGGPGKAGDVVARWERGELSAKERIEQGFANLHASRAELEAFIDAAPVDPTFAPFVKFCEEHGVPLVILSEGLVWYIRRVLERIGTAGLPIIANDIVWNDEADLSTGHVVFPYWNGDCNPCRQCGCCKRYAIRSFKAPGERVAFISDGRADRFAVKEADLVFAKGRLLDYCRLNRVRAIPFENFDDVRAALLERFEPVTIWRPR